MDIQNGTTRFVAFPTRLTSKKHNPFIGIAFTGTNFLNIEEWGIDFSYRLAKADVTLFQGDVNAKVSEGVYTSLFVNTRGETESPCDQIRETARSLSKIVPNESGRPIPTHVTGHFSRRLLRDHVLPPAYSRRDGIQVPGTDGGR